MGQTVFKRDVLALSSFLLKTEVTAGQRNAK